jgi:hypothetical protein
VQPLDCTQVTLSSLNRNAVATREDVGMPKVRFDASRTCVTLHIGRCVEEAHCARLRVRPVSVRQSSVTLACCTSAACEVQTRVALFERDRADELLGNAQGCAAYDCCRCDDVCVCASATTCGRTWWSTASTTSTQRPISCTTVRRNASALSCALARVRDCCSCAVLPVCVRLRDPTFDA